MLTWPFHSQNVTIASRNFINRKGLREYSLSIFSVTLPFFRSTMKKTNNRDTEEMRIDIPHIKALNACLLLLHFSYGETPEKILKYLQIL